MYFQSFAISRFRQFEGLEQKALGPGLIVVHGPNEAGKSTLREFFAWVLFGRRGGRSIEDGQGQVTLCAEGRTLRLVRFGSTVHVDESGRATQNEMALAPLLAGTDWALFNAIFAFDAVELQSLANLDKESVRQQLALGGSVGGARRAIQVVRQFVELEDQLWRPRAPQVAVRVAEVEVGRLEDELKHARARAARLPDLAAKRDACEAQLAALEKVMADTRKRRERLGFLLAAWPHHVDLAAVRQAQADAPPAPWTLADIAGARDALAGARSADARLVEATNNTAAATVRLAEVPSTSLILGAESEIVAAGPRLEALRRLSSELPELDARLAADMTQLSQGLAELGRAGDDDEGARWVAEAVRHPDLDQTTPFIEWTPEKAEMAARGFADDHAEHARRAALIAALEADDAASAGGAEGDHRALERAPHIAALANEAHAIPDAEQKLQRLEHEHAALADRIEAITVDFPAVEEVELEALDQCYTSRERALAGQNERRVAAEETATLAAERARALERELAALPPQAADPRPAQAVIDEAARDHREAKAAAEQLAAESRLLVAKRQGTCEQLGAGVVLTALAQADVTDAAEEEVSGLAAALNQADRDETRWREQGLEAASASGVSVAETRNEKNRAVELKAAYDDLREVEADIVRRGSTGSTGAAGWLPWAAIGALGLVGLTTAVLQLWALAAFVLALTIVLLMLAWRARRARQPVTLPSSSEARRHVAELARVFRLSSEPKRSEIEALVANLTEEQLRAEDAERKRAQADADREKLRAAAARAATARAALETARHRLGIPDGLPHDRWFKAGREVRTASATLTEIATRLHALEAKQRAALERVGITLSSAGGGVSAELTRLAAAHKQLVENWLAAESRRADLGAALREARATASDAVRRRAEVLAAGVGDALELASWASIATERGWPAGVPDGHYRELARQAASRTNLSRKSNSIRAEIGALARQLAAFGDRVFQLADELGLVGDRAVASWRTCLPELVARVDQAGERNAKRQRLAERLAAERVSHEAAAIACDQSRTRNERLTSLRQAYEAWCAALGAPADLLPAASAKWAWRLREVAAMAETVARLRSTREDARTQLEALLVEAQVLADKLGAGRADEPGTAIACIEAALAGLNDARAHKVARKERKEELARCMADERRARGVAKTAGDALRELLEARSLANDADVERAGELVGRAATMEQDRVRCESEMAKVVGALIRDISFTEELARGDLPGWGTELAQTSDREQEAARQVAEQVRLRAEVDHEARSIEASSDIVALDNALELAREHERRCVRDYARARIARFLLEHTFESYRKKHQPQVLLMASTWIATATAGAYVGIEAIEGQGPLDLQLRDQNGSPHPVNAGLSVGTLGLVYLCLRLALALHHAERAPLPIFLDDVFVHFDPERAAAAARIVAEVSKRSQVWVSTCRPETVALLLAADPTATSLFLARWAGREAPATRNRPADMQRVVDGVRSAKPGRAVPVEAGSPHEADPMGFEAVALSRDPALEAAFDLLRGAGTKLAKSDFVARFGWSESDWNKVRRKLEESRDVETTGTAKGSRYCWSGQAPASPDA